MATNGVTPTTGGTSTANTQRTPKQELGKNEFLQILATQLSNQDPLQPMQDTDFIAQMAQFSSLEQMQELNKSFSSSQASTMIGKDVLANVTDENGRSQQIYGRVNGITRRGTNDYLQVGEYYVPMSAVVTVYDSGMDSSSMISQGANLVGKTIEAKVPEEVKDETGATTTKTKTVTGVVESVVVENGVLHVKIKGNDTKIAVAWISKISDTPKTDGGAGEGDTGEGGTEESAK